MNAENSTADDQAAVWKALQLLSQQLGVERPDLVKELHGKLSPLQRYWQLDLSRSSNEVRQDVREKLEAHIATFSEPRPARQQVWGERRKRQYEQVVRANFNIHDDPKLRAQTLEDRRLWLASDERASLKIKVSTGDADFKHALDQIAEQLVPSAHASANAVPVPQPDHGTSVPSVGNPTPEATHVRRRFGRQHAVLFTATVLVAALVAGGIVYAELRSGGDASASSSKGSKYLALTAPDAYIADVNLGESAVFPPNAVASAPSGLFTQTKMPAEISSEVHSLPAHEMKAGGYLLGGAALSVDVRTVGQVQATIHDVRVVNLKRLPVFTGKAFIIQGQGGGNEDITYDLDKPSPIGVTPQTGKAWQATRHSDVTAQKKDSFELLFATNLYAYTFNVAFDYVVNGKSYTQMLNGQDGKPLLMRVSADLCPTNRNQVSAAGRAKLSALHYTSINSNVLTDLYSVAPVDPKLYGPDGIACQSAPNNKVGQGS
ncbi:hypothetical protein [Streptomyces sp. MBT53]|uniref:hypothetical protein n=1 Tax=Streptomyces sp. MBT53 TaxID=1488384 RepID=UPI0019122527|nr:hypothetical protein [Streptomyces sp. MBT53]MBK6017011.1 hypothetical protein [Streptomyces sp. MBT53]